MSKRIRLLPVIALLGALLAACTSVRAAPRPEYAASPRAITVIGQGEVSLKPDVATINVGAEARANTASEAKAEVDAQMAAIVTTLQETGITEEDIQTSHYSIYYEQEPVMREGPAPESQGGYRVSSMVQVTVRDVEKAGDVLDAVVEAGANQVYGVTFTVADETIWQSEARAKAMADARSRAQELADLAEVELGEVLSVSEIIGSAPVPMLESKLGMGGGGIAPGELELGTQLQVTFAIR
jgi:uncharacterized protein YggE